MKTSDFDYVLPDELIAQKSVEPKDSSRLMVVSRAKGTISEHVFRELPSLLKQGDLLVFNNSKVFKARLRGMIGEVELEVFLLRESETGVWDALAKPAKKIPIGGVVYFADGITATLISKTDDGVLSFKFSLSRDEVLEFTEKHGEIPVPPYVGEAPTDTVDYQTLYAKEVGSVAAPTAGFHFTEAVFNDLESRGIDTAFLTLHVGIGTFRPIQTDTLEEHSMHEEYFTIPEETQKRIAEAKRDGRRVIAVGTTTLRALESGISGKTNIFITPGYSFKVVDALITNFHLPKSTLLVLVSAFAGYDLIKTAYAKAIAEKFRFYSFGDAMFIE